MQRQGIADAWTMIDCIHRVGELLRLAKVAVNEEEEALIESIRLLRNSYQHSSERIAEHFLPEVQSSGSVFGDLSWYYHPDIYRAGSFSSYITQFTLRTGMTFKEERTMQVGNDIANMQFAGIISNVDIHYVVKPKLKDPNTFLMTVSLDKAVAMVNRAIARISDTIVKMEKAAEVMRAQNPGYSYRGYSPLLIEHTTNYSVTRA